MLLTPSQTGRQVRPEAHHTAMPLLCSCKRHLALWGGAMAMAQCSRASTPLQTCHADLTRSRSVQQQQLQQQQQVRRCLPPPPYLFTAAAAAPTPPPPPQALSCRCALLLAHAAAAATQPGS